MIEKLITTLESGGVIRFHAVPSVKGNQSVAEHSWGVSTILVGLWQAGGTFHLGNVLAYAALHDAAELFTGDIPFNVKRDNPAMKAICTTLEHEAERSLLTLPKLTEEEHQLVKFADICEGLFYCLENDALGLVTERWRHALRTVARPLYNSVDNNSLANMIYEMCVFFDCANFEEEGTEPTSAYVNQ